MKQLFITLACMCCLCSCVDEKSFDDSPRGNLEALWRIIDEHYCFFDYKHIDWQEVHQRYAKQVNEHITKQQLFEVLSNMLAELRDGHVNLYASFDLGRYWKWHENYPANFSDTLFNHYIGTDYRISGGMKYRILDDHIGYIYCGPFAKSFGAGNLDDILYYLAPCNGLIIDIRNNSGGMLTAAEQLAARFTNSRLLVGYIQHKTGRGHQDFSKMEEQYLEPGKGIRWQKQVVVLTNRSVYSAANEFVKYMKCCPNVRIVGDKTGGGAGLPFSSELPNGWGVRFSACPMYDIHRQSTEFGIDPDHQVALKEEDKARNIDTIVEFARHLLHNPTSQSHP